MVLELTPSKSDTTNTLENSQNVYDENNTNRLVRFINFK